MTHYLEPAVRSKSIQLFERKDEDLFKVQAAPVSCYHNSDLVIFFFLIFYQYNMISLIHYY